MHYCQSPYLYERRKSREVVIGDPKNGGVIIGRDHPVVKQSMLTCDTIDAAACVKQTLEPVEVGFPPIRITSPPGKGAHTRNTIVPAPPARGWPSPKLT